MSVLERFQLMGRRALVTGASSGLGRHFALSLAQAGASVIVAARSVDKAFNMFRMASILQGILARAMQGNATSPEALATDKRARPMAEAGWRQVEQMQR